MEIFHKNYSADPILIRDNLFNINFLTQEVTPKIKVGFKEDFFFLDISYEDFYNSILMENFGKSSPEFYISTVLKQNPIYKIDLRDKEGCNNYLNLMNSPKKVNLLIPDVGLSIINEQILFFSKDATWYLHAHRYYDSAILYSKNIISSEAFNSSR